ncbi:MAG: phage head morphogenesis protein [Methanobrevibacter sp.]|jgi:hypothetical protein|nr:phage head morphogenesis protein [Methanobrevibacter sp.]
MIYDSYDDEEKNREFFELLLFFLLKTYNENTALFISEIYFKILMDAINNNNYKNLENIQKLIKSNPDKAVLEIKKIGETISNEYLNDSTLNIYRAWLLEVMEKIKFNYIDDKENYLNNRLQDIISSIMSYSYLQDAIAQGYTHKKWLTMEDSRVRPAHRQIDRSVIPISEPFVNSSGSIQYPHDAEASMDNTVNCRCTLQFIKSD